MCAERGRIFLRAQLELEDEVSRSITLQDFHNNAKTIEIDGETLYKLEGDLLLDQDQLDLYALQREASQREHNMGLGAGTLTGGLGIAPMTVQPNLSASALIGITRGGKIVRWNEGLVLSYCVLRGTFPDQQEYELVCDNMKKATEDWQQTCGITFQYRNDLDGSPNVENPGVIFTVRGINAGGTFIAAAFFPDDPVNRRRVLIDPSYFDPNLRFDKVGVLRHELGHVLGFRHEHISSGAPPACPDEPLGDTIKLTEYDPQSVMHYFCGGVGSPELAITELDREGSQKVYGPPFNTFHLVENAFHLVD